MTIRKPSATNRAETEGPQPAVLPGEVFFSYLTDKQNAMLREYVRNGRQVLKAYQHAYKNNMAEKTAEVAAFKCMQTNSMRLALAEIEKVAAQECGINLAVHLRDLKGLRDKAEQARQFSAAISAEVARGKAAGLYVQRVEVTGKDGAPVGVTDVPLDDYLKAREKVLGDC